jgi:hypothetical protein
LPELNCGSARAFRLGSHRRAADYCGLRPRPLLSGGPEMARRSTGRRSLARSSPRHALTGIAQHLLLLFGKRRSSPGSPAWCVCRYASIETARSDGAGSAVARRSRYSAGRVTKAADLNGRRQPAEKPPRAPIGQRQLLIIGGGLGLVCLVDGIWIRQGPASTVEVENGALALGAACAGVPGASPRS